MTSPSRPAWGHDPSRRCTAHNRKGERCRQVAIRGGNVCQAHGGSSPRVKAKAQKRLAEEKVLADWKSLARPARTLKPANPAEVLLFEIAWSQAFVEYLRSRLAEVDPDYLTWGMTERTTKTTAEVPAEVTEKYGAEINALVKLLGSERDRLTRQIDAAIKLGIESSQIEAASKLAHQFFQMVDKALKAAGVPDPMAHVFKAAMADGLRAEDAEGST